MKTMKTPFKQMLAAVPADIQQEVDLEFAISNRINELMVQRGLTKLEFAQALGNRTTKTLKASPLNSRGCESTPGMSSDMEHAP